MKKTLLGLFAVLFLATSAIAKVETFTLSNGIKVLFDKTDGVEVVSLKVWTPVAVIDEDKNNAGISALLNSLMEQSTLNRPSEVLDADIENIGASLSSAIDYDYAFIGIDFLAEYLEAATEILSDIIVNPAFNADEIKFEKLEQIAALNSQKDSIQAHTFNFFNAIFYQNTSYALPILGTPSSINSITTDDLKARHQKSFNASNIIITAAGNVSSSALQKSLEKNFAGIDRGEKFQEPPFNFKQTAQTIYTRKDKFNQAFILSAYPAPNLNGKDFAAIKVMSEILGGRMSSRLFVELREKLGLAYVVGSVYPTRIKTSYFAIFIGLDRQNIDLTLQKIGEILADFQSKKISSEELNDAKAYLKGNYLMARQTASSKSLVLGMREMWGQGWAYDSAYLDDVDKVSVDDIY
ncbi:MAG: insulinase family protein, partial [Elusimicrobiota bacterium]|nr:insulinase family protein [Elusimicrobiota bacterium]